jgi:hypothetical protein
MSITLKHYKHREKDFGENKEIRMTVRVIDLEGARKFT